MVWLVTRSQNSPTCREGSCDARSTDAPDPGGDPSANVGLPPKKILFGFNDNPQVEGVKPEDLASLATDAGANARRFPLDWRVVEPVRDQWDEGGWAYYQTAYDTTLDAGMTPVIDFGFAPQWARDPGEPQQCADFFACRYPPSSAMDDEWIEFAEEVAKRFPRAVLEVWNEPNLAIFWRPSPDPVRYTALQALAYRAIKAVNPSQTVLSGGLSAIQAPSTSLAGAGPSDVPLEDFLLGAYGAGLAESIDGLSFHPYVYDGTGAGSTFAKGFEDIRAAAKTAGQSNTPLWVTETGVSSEGDGAVSEEEQATDTLALYRRLATMDDVKAVFIHRLVPPPTEPLGSSERGFALTNATPTGLTAKPAYCALVGLAGSDSALC